MGGDYYYAGGIKQLIAPILITASHAPPPKSSLPDLIG